LYNTGLTVKDALDSISKNLYVLPAIQREFVWAPEQISRLFDSLMQGYPFGTFLFWKVEPEKSGLFKFYGFVQNYHERDAPHCPELGVLPNRELTAVLDGQQRLTALNIGLRGSMAIKEPNKWRTNPNAFPKKVLYLNLFAVKGEEEEGEAHSFRFRDPDTANSDLDALWYPVSEILAVANVGKLSQWLHAKLNERNIGHNDALFNRASDTLHQLYTVIHTAPTIAFYTEKSQELDRVLRIFIRMNSGGTVLSYSDLLLSIAVAQWSKLDARQEIHSLVGSLNKIGPGFKVENFNRANMNALEAIWPAVRKACNLTVELVASFGFTEQMLRADSALLPIAYFLFKRNPPSNWLILPACATEREEVRSWLIRSLLKAGIWGSGLDTLLTALREIIKNDYAVFPTEKLEKEMAARGKSLMFGAEEIGGLLEMEYGDRRVFPLLSLLYPFVDTSQLHHIDHFFPYSAFQKKGLEKRGCNAEYVEEAQEARNQIPNLLLLEGLLNVSKNDMLPEPWLETRYPDLVNREAAISRLDLGTVPKDELGFMTFFNARKLKLQQRLEGMLLSKQAPASEPAVLTALLS
jgi:hypothetical protein